jgi:hypothetical protein
MAEFWLMECPCVRIVPNFATDTECAATELQAPPHHYHRAGAQETVMAVIDVVIQPDGRTRVWFDCRDTKPRPEDEQRIEQALVHALAEVRDPDAVQAD